MRTHMIHTHDITLTGAGFRPEVHEIPASIAERVRANEFTREHIENMTRIKTLGMWAQTRWVCGKLTVTQCIEYLKGCR